MVYTGSVVLPFSFRAHFRRVYIGRMATVLIYLPEILPLKLRAKGAALGEAADFLGNFVVRIHHPV